MPIPYRQEIFRKLIHLGGLWIPLAVFLWDTHAMLVTLGALAVLSACIDRLRHVWPALRRGIERAFGAMLRAHEHKGWTGATTLLAASFLCVLLFPRLIAVTSLAILILSDTLAALVGRKYGTRRLFDKSLEGTAAFTLSALVIVALIAPASDAPLSFLLAGIVGSLVAAGVELLSGRLRIDDNFSIPLCAGVTMLLCGG